MRRILALFMSFLMIVLAVGCGSTTPATTTAAATTAAATTAAATEATTAAESTEATTTAAAEPTVKTEPVKLDYWIPMTGDAALFMKTLEDNVTWKHWQEVTNTDLNFISPAVGDEATAFNLMIAASDLPDMIHMNPYSGYSYPGGGAKAVADGVFLKLNDLIDANAPNFSKVINSTPEFKRSVITDDGTIWGMGMLENVRQTSYWGPTVRADWLEELNIKKPTTIPEWREMLKAFKEKKGCTAPYIYNFHGTSWFLGWAYDVDIANTWLQRDNKVVYSFTDPGYLEYLTEMNMWYKEGYISKDFNSDVTNDMMAQSKGGAFETGFWMFTIYENTLKEKEPNAKLSPLAYPQKDSNTPVKIRVLESHNRSFETVVTTSCKDPVAAVKFLDWGYSDPDGYLWCNYGEEGVSYTMVDGKPQWTDFMTKNPDGFDLNQLMKKYSLQSGSYVRDWQCIFVAYSPQANETLTLWDGDSSHLLVTRLLSFTQEEGNTNATVMADIDTYVKEMTIKFIKGEEPLSNWDAFVTTINDMGLASVVTNYQAAYDRYLNRK
jgi:putative aldouronate transport system substrate-binding protein